MKLRSTPATATPSINVKNSVIDAINERLLSRAPNLTLIEVPNYQNRFSRCLVRCVIHGDCWMWGNPWRPTLEKLRQAKRCPKCSGRYTRSLEEQKSFLRTKLASHLTLIDIPDYTGNRSLCWVRCAIHGDGWRFGNPWLPQVVVLAKGHGCPKCSDKYSPTKQEAIEELNDLGKGRYRVLDIPDYTGANSRCVMECLVHGPGNAMPEPWNPVVTALRVGHGCPYCSGNRHLKDEQALLQQINQVLRPPLQALRIPDYKNQGSIVEVYCPVHGHGRNWDRPYLPTANNLLKGPGCLKCDNRYSPTREEMKQILTEVLPSHLTLIAVLEDQGKNTRFHLHCQHHGDTWLFGNPWLPTFETLKSGTNCPKCAKVYPETKEETLNTLRQALGDRLTVVDIPKFEGRNSRCQVACSVHGRGWTWPRPWMPTVMDLLTLTHGCPKCAKRYQRSESEAEAHVRSVLDPSVQLVGILDYENIYSRCVLRCQEHGRSDLWGNPWLITISKITEKTRCLKCIGQYQPTKEEAMERVAGRLLPHLTLVDIPDYKNLRSACQILCDIHGETWRGAKGWLPSADQMIRVGNNCPDCVKAGRWLVTSKENPEIGQRPCTLYWLKLRHCVQVFWKIGITSRPLTDRFRGRDLARDQVEILDARQLHVTAYDATLAESYLLLFSAQEHRLDMQHVLQRCGGGTECFKQDVLADLSLEGLLERARCNEEAVLDLVDFDTDKD